MGKSGRSDKCAGRLMRELSIQNALVKKAKPKSKPKATLSPATSSDLPRNPSHELSCSIDSQQTLLNIFKAVSGPVLASDDLQSTIQNIKDALFNRDFKRAFTTQNYLEAYTARWSPSRALCYQNILVDIRPSLIDVLPRFGLEKSRHEVMTSASILNKVKVVCFGGGVAEAVAFSGFARYLMDESYQQNKSSNISNLTTSQSTLALDIPEFKVCLVDSAEWQDVIHKFATALSEDLPSVPTDENAGSTQKLPRPPTMNIRFSQFDILTMSPTQIIDLVGQDEILITLFFTLNELYASSVCQTTAFLFNLTAALKVGSVLLVVDSPGSYSETSIGSATKKYPINWLLDYCLLSESSKISDNTSPKWAKLINDNSKWFRISEKLKYPIPLENMRYQIHLYQRV